MDTWMWVILLIVVAVVAAVVAYVVATRVRSVRLKKRFGPEYDRAVEAIGDRKDAEGGLRDIADRRDRFEIVPLSASRRRHYATEWEAIQHQFVDEPVPAVAAADDLIVSVMSERGYPVEKSDERAGMVSVDHPDVASNYRAANAIRRQGPEASTEDLREAFLHYRTLFDQMLADDTDDTRAKAAETKRGGQHGDVG